MSRVGSAAPELRRRTAWHAAEFFRRTRSEEILRWLPLRAETERQALEEYARACRPGADSEGRVIYCEGRYVGDVWCYAIRPRNARDPDGPDAMLSCCVFARELWGRGIAAAAVRQFLAEVLAPRGLRRVGAFTFAENTASVRLLTRCGFALRETLDEGGVRSYYFETRPDAE